MVMAAWLFVHAQFGLSGVPMPVIIQTGREYKVDEIYSSITVPLNWTGDCYNQRILVLQMAKYFNNQLNGNQKKPEVKLKEIEDEWVCVE